MASLGQRRDSKHRVLRRGESIRADGKYQFKYIVNGKPKFLYSWRLTPTDPLPAGKQPFKQDANPASGEDRLKMLESAFSGFPEIEFSVDQADDCAHPALLIRDAVKDIKF